MPQLLAVGQIARDLALRIDQVPEGGGTTPVRQRREMLGGKGANQAVSATQLGAPAALLAVVGNDGTGEWLLRQAAADGIDVGCVVPRAQTSSALMVDVVDEQGSWRYLEDVPGGTLLTAPDVAAAEAAFAAADAVLIQLQQPGAACRAAAAAAARHGDLIVLDGAPQEADRDALLERAEVVRADAQEAALWTGRELAGTDEVLDAAESLVACGPALVVLAAGSDGNVLAWSGGSTVLPLIEARVVDTTGAGDAFTAALAIDLLRHGDPERACRYATAAASFVVEHLGGRPALDPRAVERRLGL